MLGALREAVRDQVALAAAGCGFYATLALFPAISMLISVYGLAFDVVAVEQQLAVVRNLLPPPAYTLIDDRVHELVSQPSDTLSVGLLVSVLRRLLERRGRHQVGAVGAERRLRHRGTTRHPGVPAHRVWR